jgi:hypothetical protein
MPTIAAIRAPPPPPGSSRSKTTLPAQGRTRCQCWRKIACSPMNATPCARSTGSGCTAWTISAIVSPAGTA